MKMRPQPMCVIDRLRKNRWKILDAQSSGRISHHRSRDRIRREGRVMVGLPALGSAASGAF